jgi:hypothetical protein
METIKRGKFIYCYDIEEPRLDLLKRAVQKLSGTTYDVTEIYEVIVNTEKKECRIKYLAEDCGYDRVLFLTVPNDKLEITIEQYKNKAKKDYTFSYQNIETKDAPLTTSFINKLSCFKAVAINSIHINIKLNLMEIYYVTMAQKEPKRTSLKLNKKFVFYSDPILKELGKAKEHTHTLIETGEYDYITGNHPVYPEKQLFHTNISNYRLAEQYYANASI